MNTMTLKTEAQAAARVSDSEEDAAGCGGSGRSRVLSGPDSTTRRCFSILSKGTSCSVTTRWQCFLKGLPGGSLGGSFGGSNGSIWY